MSSKHTEPRSIASQLVLLFTPGAALLLCCSLGLLYWIVLRHALAEDRAVLDDKILAVRADLSTARGPNLLHEQVQTQRPGDRTVYWVRVMDSAGKVLAETPGMDRLLPVDVFPGARKASSAAAAPQTLRTDGRLFSLVTTNEQISGATYSVQIAQDRSEDEAFTKQFGMLVVAVLACGVLASAAMAVTVTKRGLRPLGEMTRSLKRVAPDHLNERVPPAEWPRELQPVAIAFDQMLDRLEDSFTRLSQFSADVAHEFRTPIANIRGEAEVALIRPRSPNEYQEVIESSIAECERLSAIIDNLLFLARAEAAQTQVQRTLLDGRATLDKIAAYYEAIAEERQITLSCTGAGEIYADPILLGRAVSNLVDNALRFTPAGGTILISLETEPGGARISVKDTGCGIGAQHLPRVFDRFYRADVSRSSEGTGLGLALVKSIADLHGASVTIESEVNCGTTVSLSVPAKPTA
jgi:two-component system heavy metal sensor histidine kinase CusS